MAHLEAKSDDKWPPKEEIAGVFLLIGPLGRGSFAILDLGTMAQKVFQHEMFEADMKAQFISPQSSEVWEATCLMMGLVIWGWGLLWIFIAFSGLFINLRRGPIPFNPSWWAFTFPLGNQRPKRRLTLGTFGLASGLLGQKMDDAFFKVVACAFTLVVLLFWILVSFKCIQYGVNGMTLSASLSEKERNRRIKGERMANGSNGSADLTHFAYIPGHSPSSEFSIPV